MDGEREGRGEAALARGKRHDKKKRKAPLERKDGSVKGRGRGRENKSVKNESIGGVFRRGGVGRGRAAGGEAWRRSRADLRPPFCDNGTPEARAERGLPYLIG